MKLRGDSASNVRRSLTRVAFTPKGGCPLKLERLQIPRQMPWRQVAFTPKGGCPLKRSGNGCDPTRQSRVAFTPKGGCPLKQPVCPGDIAAGLKRA